MRCFLPSRAAGFPVGEWLPKSGRISYPVVKVRTDTNRKSVYLDLPVKVISLCDLGLGVDTLAPGETSHAEGTDPGVDIALLALAGRQAFVPVR